MPSVFDSWPTSAQTWLRGNLTEAEMAVYLWDEAELLRSNIEPSYSSFTLIPQYHCPIPRIPGFEAADTGMSLGGDKLLKLASSEFAKLVLVRRNKKRILKKILESQAQKKSTLSPSNQSQDSAKIDMPSTDADTGELTRIVANLKTKSNWAQYLNKSFGMRITTVMFCQILFSIAERTAFWRAEMWHKHQQVSGKSLTISPEPYHFEPQRIEENSDEAKTSDITKGGGVTTVGRLLVAPFMQIIRSIAPLMELPRSISAILPAVPFKADTLDRLELLTSELQRYGYWISLEPNINMKNDIRYSSAQESKDENDETYSLGGFWLRKKALEQDRQLQNIVHVRWVTVKGGRLGYVPQEYRQADIPVADGIEDVYFGAWIRIYDNDRPLTSNRETSDSVAELNAFLFSDNTETVLRSSIRSILAYMWASSKKQYAHFLASRKEGSSTADSFSFELTTLQCVVNIHTFFDHFSGSANTDLAPNAAEDKTETPSDDDDGDDADKENAVRSSHDEDTGPKTFKTKQFTEPLAFTLQLADAFRFLVSSLNEDMLKTDSLENDEELLRELVNAFERIKAGQVDGAAKYAKIEEALRKDNTERENPSPKPPKTHVLPLLSAVIDCVALDIRDSHNTVVTRAICSSGQRLSHKLRQTKLLPANMSNNLQAVSAEKQAQKGLLDKSKGVRELSSLTSDQQKSYLGMMFNSLKDLLRLRHKCMKLSSEEIRKIEVKPNNEAGSSYGNNARPTSVAEYDNLINNVIKSEGWVPLDLVVSFLNRIFTRGKLAFEPSANILGFGTGENSGGKSGKKQPIADSLFADIKPITPPFLVNVLQQHDLLQRYEVGMCSCGQYNNRRCVRSVYAHEEVSKESNLFQTIFLQRQRVYASAVDKKNELAPSSAPSKNLRRYWFTNRSFSKSAPSSDSSNPSQELSTLPRPPLTAWYAVVKKGDRKGYIEELTNVKSNGLQLYDRTSFITLITPEAIFRERDFTNLLDGNDEDDFLDTTSEQEEVEPVFKDINRPMSEIFNESSVPERKLLTGYISDYILANIQNPDMQCDEKLKGINDLRLFEVDLYALAKDKRMIVKQLPDRENVDGNTTSVIEGHYIVMPSEAYQDRTKKWFPSDFFTGRQIEISQTESSQLSPLLKEVKVEFIKEFCPFYFKRADGTSAPQRGLRTFSHHFRQVKDEEKNYIFSHRIKESGVDSLEILSTAETQESVDEHAPVFALNIQGHCNIIESFASNEKLSQAWMLIPKCVMYMASKNPADERESQYLSSCKQSMRQEMHKKMKYIKNRRLEIESNGGTEEEINAQFKIPREFEPSVIIDIINPDVVTLYKPLKSLRSTISYRTDDMKKIHEDIASRGLKYQVIKYKEPSALTQGMSEEDSKKLQKVFLGSDADAMSVKTLHEWYTVLLLTKKIEIGNDEMVRKVITEILGETSTEKEPGRSAQRHKFPSRDLNLYRRALTRRTNASVTAPIVPKSENGEQKGWSVIRDDNYEQLEFTGDTLLDYCVMRDSVALDAVKQLMKAKTSVPRGLESLAAHTMQKMETSKGIPDVENVTADVCNNEVLSFVLPQELKRQITMEEFGGIAGFNAGLLSSQTEETTCAKQLKYFGFQYVIDPYRQVLSAQLAAIQAQYSSDRFGERKATLPELFEEYYKEFQIQTSGVIGMKVKADMLEALFGAVYEDGLGIDGVRKMCHVIFSQLVENLRDNFSLAVAFGDEVSSAEQKLSRARQRSPHTIAVQILQQVSGIRGLDEELKGKPSPFSSIAPTEKASQLADAASFMFSPFDCTTVFNLSEDDLNNMASHFETKEAADFEDDSEQPIESYMGTGKEEEAKEKTGGGIIFFVTENSHGGSSGYCRIQDKNYATHFSTGNVYSYRRMEHYHYAPHLPQALVSTSSGCILPITSVLKMYFYGDISFQNETMVLHVNQQGHLASAAEVSSAPTALNFPKLPSTPFVPFTIDFDGMAITAHGVDKIMAKYLRVTFYDPQDEQTSVPPVGGLILDCTGRTQRKVNGKHSWKYKHSCHVHFPSIVMSLTDLERHTNRIRQFILSEKLSEYTRSMVKPGDVVIHNGVVYLSVFTKDWVSWVATTLTASRRKIVVRGKERPHPTDIVAEYMYDVLSLTALCFTSANWRHSACKRLLQLLPSTFSLLRPIKLSERDKCTAPKIDWEAEDKFISSDSIPAASNITMFKTKIDLEFVNQDALTNVKDLPANKRTEAFNNLKEKLMEKNPNSEHLWNKVVDTGLVVSKKLRMYLCDKFDQTYFQEFRPLQFERFISFQDSDAQGHPSPDIAGSVNVNGKSGKGLIELNFEDMFGFEDNEDAVSNAVEPSVLIPHDQIISMSTLQRAKVFDIYGDQHFVDNHKGSSPSTSKAQGFNPLLPAPQQLMNLGPLTECESSAPTTVLNATCPLLPMKPRGPNASVVKYGGLHPCYLLCTHHADNSGNIFATAAFYVGAQQVISLTAPATEKSASKSLIKMLNDSLLQIHAAIFAPQVSIANVNGNWSPANIKANTKDSKDSSCCLHLLVETEGSTGIKSKGTKATEKATTAVPVFSLPKVVPPRPKKTLIDHNTLLKFAASSRTAEMNKTAENVMVTQKDAFRSKWNASIVSLQACDFLSFERMAERNIFIGNSREAQHSYYSLYLDMIVRPSLLLYVRTATADGMCPLDPHSADTQATTVSHAGGEDKLMADIRVAVVCFRTKSFEKVTLWKRGFDEILSLQKRNDHEDGKGLFPVHSILNQGNLSPWRALFQGVRQTTIVINFQNSDHTKLLQQQNSPRNFNIVILVDPLPTTDANYHRLVIGLAKEQIVVMTDEDGLELKKHMRA